MGALLDSIKALDWVAILAIVVAFNTALKSIDSFLSKVKDKTSTDADNKISSVLTTAIGVLEKIIEFIGNNTKPKVVEVKAEEKK